MDFRKDYLLIVLLLVFGSGLSNAQEQTVGVFQLEADAMDGYTLFSPSTNETVYLIDNCGRLVHSWECTGRPGNAVYLMPDGTLYRAGRVNNLQIHAGGAGGLIEQYDWNNELLWHYTYSSPQYRAHHDFQVLPNGNVLILAWEVKDEATCLANGRDPNLLSDGKLWPEHIVEVAPSGADGGTIVWEWHAWDHLIQDYDPTKANYGVVSEHPEKIDINYIQPGRDGADWMHANSIHYNADLDQIMISVAYFDEIWIIDHNTTTAEAAGPSGDLLFRWGNPQAYGQGDGSDQVFFGQHSAHWIDAGLPDAGKVLVFNNGTGRPDSLYSNVVKIEPSFEAGAYQRAPSGDFLPTGFSWEYQGDPPTSFFSRFISGAQQLPNGNILVTDGVHGRFFEINASHEIVWEYISPVTIFGIAAQGNLVVNPIGEGINTVFRAIKFTPDYPAFANRDLTPGDPIEIDPLPISCTVVNTIEPEISSRTIFPNPANDELFVEGYQGTYRLFNLQGQRLLMGQVESKVPISLEQVESGMYFLELGGQLEKIIIQR
jgi:hypothetical protein